MTSLGRALRGPFGGEGGIRTRGGCLAPTRFPGVRLKPLIHLSGDDDLSRALQPLEAHRSRPAPRARRREHTQGAPAPWQPECRQGLSGWSSQVQPRSADPLHAVQSSRSLSEGEVIEKAARTSPD